MRGTDLDVLLEDTVLRLDGRAIDADVPIGTGKEAVPLAVSCPSMAQAFALKGGAAQRHGEKIAALLTHAGKDPNWRRRPAVFDQLRGWKRPPIARQETHSGEVSDGNIKTAA